MGRKAIRVAAWERGDRSIICGGCGAVCVRPGWLERAVNSFYGRHHACCICSGEETPCINCRKLRKREPGSAGPALDSRA